MGVAMQLVLDIILLTVVALALVPVAMFCLEVLVSLFPSRSKTTYALPPGARVAVLIPAHNEEAVIEQTLRTLMPTIPAGGTVLVVADNCTDGTAEAARGLGAEVVERFDAERRGKGFALDFGLQTLAANPPDAVVFLDADCQAEQPLVTQLAAAAIETGRPVQGLNLCDPDPQGGALQAVSSLAFRFKNLVRTLGLTRLAGLNYLSGTGMALPWRLAITHSVAGANVVEDMQWGIDLALTGHPPMFLPSAVVRSPLPRQRAAARTQRTRWEHGHLKTLLSQTPKLLRQALQHHRIDLALLALDLSVPPLSLLVLTMTASLGAVCLSAVLGITGWWPAILLLAGELALALAIAAGWWRHCRQVIPLRALCTAPFYAAMKLPIYVDFLWKRQREWVRTEREASAPVVR